MIYNLNYTKNGTVNRQLVINPFDHSLMLKLSCGERKYVKIHCVCLCDHIKPMLMV
jgi:hypothetical protein